MISIPNSTTSVEVWSNWDSGVHKGFKCGIKQEHNLYTVTSLDQFLTKEEITTVEITIAYIVSEMIKSKA